MKEALLGVLWERYSYRRTLGKKTVVRQMGQLSHSVTVTEHTSPRPPRSPEANETQIMPQESTQTAGRPWGLCNHTAWVQIPA